MKYCSKDRFVPEKTGSVLKYANWAMTIKWKMRLQPVTRKGFTSDEDKRYQLVAKGIRRDLFSISYGPIFWKAYTPSASKSPVTYTLIDADQLATKLKYSGTLPSSEHRVFLKFSKKYKAWLSQENNRLKELSDFQIKMWESLRDANSETTGLSVYFSF